MDAPFDLGRMRAISRAGGFSLETLETLFSVLGAERMQRLFQVSRLEFAEAAVRLNQAVAAQDLRLCQEEAHGLRGAAANIRAVALADAVANYEMTLRDSVFCPQLLDAIHAAIALADDALARLEPVV